MIGEKMQWEWEINKSTSWLGTSLKELIQYKDLLFRLVRKEFLSAYQQTLLGPFWVLLQPMLTVLTSLLIFNQIIGVSTDGIPPLVYYLAGITMWNLFSEIFLGTAVTFTQNASVFSKVYFPRIIVPLSVALLSGVRFLIQILLLAAAMIYYYLTGQITVNIVTLLLAVPAVIITAGIGIGSGLMFSILTAKYRDFLGLLQILLRLMMFVCPIFYPMSIVPQKLKWVMNLNPLSSQFELFRFGLLGRGDFTAGHILYSFVFMVILFGGGMLLFNKMGDKLIDIV
jgi:lipopolysaccharide transport system permease protein